MVWKISEQELAIQYVKDGQSTAHKYDKSSSLFDAVSDVARKHSVTNVNVFVDDTEISEDEGKRPLSDFSGKCIKVVPKNVASC